MYGGCLFRNTLCVLDTGSERHAGGRCLALSPDPHPEETVSAQHPWDPAFCSSHATCITPQALPLRGPGGGGSASAVCVIVCARARTCVVISFLLTSTVPLQHTGADGSEGTLPRNWLHSWQSSGSMWGERAESSHLGCINTVFFGECQQKPLM